MYSNIPLECAECKRNYVHETEVGWLMRVEDNAVKFLLCPECGAGKEVSEDKIDVKFVGRNDQIRNIRSTVFHAVKADAEVGRFRKGKASLEFWEGFEGEVFHFVENEPHLLKITLTTPQFKKMFMQFRWENKKLVGITIPGDLPRQGQFFNIYQRHRLAQMGLTESGSKNKEWSIDLPSEETDPLNIALIAGHILQFGVMLDPIKVTGNTSTLDFDSAKGLPN